MPALPAGAQGKAVRSWDLRAVKVESFEADKDVREDFLVFPFSSSAILIPLGSKLIFPVSIGHLDEDECKLISTAIQNKAKRISRSTAAKSNLSFDRSRW